MVSKQGGQQPDGVILCGGRGTRMGGTDKGLMTMDGTPAAACAAELLRPLCGALVINANRNLERYEALGLGKVIADRRPDFPGPLGGLETVVPHVNSDRILVLPCDMPKLRSAVPEQLIETLDARRALDVVYARSGSDNHYLVAAIRSHALHLIPTLLDRGQRSVRGWYRELKHEALEFPKAMAGDFLNLNDARSAAHTGISG